MIIKIELTSEQENILKNDLLDIRSWLQDDVDGKIHNCRKRMFRGWQARLKARYEMLPTSDSDLIALILSQPDYKNRAAREAP